MCWSPSPLRTSWGEVASKGSSEPLAGRRVSTGRVEALARLMATTTSGKLLAIT